MQYYPEAPKELVSISELVQQQQTILAKNGENQRKRQEINRISQQFEIERQQIENLRQQLMALEEKHDQTAADLEIAQKSALNLQDESTEELEKILLKLMRSIEKFA